MCCIISLLSACRKADFHKMCLLGLLLEAARLIAG
jgi:hypothetical protein